MLASSPAVNCMRRSKPMRRAKQTSLDLSSDKLGLYGKVDCLRRRDGSYLPYEHKRGRPHRNDDGTSSAWPSDRLQIIAYAVLLEETFGQTIPEGRVRYHAVNITVRVPIDEQARADLRDAIAMAQRLRDSVERPPITENERLCEKCSLVTGLLAGGSPSTTRCHAQAGASVST